MAVQSMYVWLPAVGALRAEGACCSASYEMGVVRAGVVRIVSTVGTNRESPTLSPNELEKRNSLATSGVARRVCIAVSACKLYSANTSIRTVTRMLAAASSIVTLAPVVMVANREMMAACISDV